MTPTDLIEIDQDQPAAEAIAAAAAQIRRGGVVAIPTDALYTLVADPFNLQAVRRVFAAKGRESLYSLPLLVSDFLMAEELVKEPPVRFNLLVRRFWRWDPELAALLRTPAARERVRVLPHISDEQLNAFRTRTLELARRIRSPD